LTNDTLLFYKYAPFPSTSFVKTKLSGYSGLYANTMQFINDSTGILNLTRKEDLTKTVLLKTMDYGSNWSEIYLESTDSITSFSFPNINTGYISKKMAQFIKQLMEE